MGTEQSDKLDDVAEGLDELTTKVDELADDPPQGADPGAIEKLGRWIQKARDTADDLENETK